MEEKSGILPGQDWWVVAAVGSPSFAYYCANRPKGSPFKRPNGHHQGGQHAPHGSACACSVTKR